jgi:hypothetical protein
VRTYDEIWADAKDEPAFSNSTEWEYWSASWCDECINEPEDENEAAVNGCPLISVGFLGKTPKEWVPTSNPSRVPALGDCSLDCLMFRDEDDGPDPEPQPIPDPPGMDPLFPREPFEGVKMYRPIFEKETANA